MKLKRTLIVAIVGVFFASCFALVADPINGIEEGRAQETFEFIPDEVHVIETTEAVTGKGNGGPEVVEYYEYKEDKAPAKPGSLSDQYDFATIGKGLFYDGTDFYYFTDTGIVASNFMKTIEGDRFFFGEDGKMVKGQLVNFEDELYYFDVNGAMYKNRWYTHEEIDDVDNTITYTDYYFGPTGRAYRASDNGNNLIVKTIEEEKYGFNSDGEKLEGYYGADGTEYNPDDDPAYEGSIYYFDPQENGAAKTGWHYYEGATRGDDYDDDEELVMYFDPKTARKVYAKSANDSERCVSRIIDGQRYMFDRKGIRRNKWYVSEPGRNLPGATASNVKFFSEEYDGYLQKGWFTAVPGSYVKKGADLILDVNKKRHDDEEECWFYAGSNGNILRKTIRKIGKYTYAFDDDGVMQQNAMVKVKNGEFIKAYNCDLITKANVLCDPEEYGDAERDHGRSATSNPIDLPKEEGLLHLDEGERWMFFLNDENDITAGSKCKENVLVKIEFADDTVDFYCNSIGGYFSESQMDASDPNSKLVSTPVERGGKYIQNGVILKPNPDDNNYGLMRYIPSKQGFGDVISGNDKIVNWQNKPMNLSGLERRIYYPINASGNKYKGEYKSFKDKQGDWIWVGYNGEFLGCFSYQGKFEQFKASSDEPYIQVNEYGDKAQPGETVVYTIYDGNWYWKYKKDAAKNYSYGMPAKEQRNSCKDLALNYNGSSKISGTPGDPDADFGPYVDGLAALVYEN